MSARNTCGRRTADHGPAVGAGPTSVELRHARDTEMWTSGHAWQVVANMWIEPTPEGAAVHYYMLGMETSTRWGASWTMWRVRTRAGASERREFTMDRPATPPDLV
ncbi:hypothetical protein [Streptodolium elevatio]